MVRLLGDCCCIRFKALHFALLMACAFCMVVWPARFALFYDPYAWYIYDLGVVNGLCSAFLINETSVWSSAAYTCCALHFLLMKPPFGARLCIHVMLCIFLLMKPPFGSSAGYICCAFWLLWQGRSIASGWLIINPVFVAWQGRSICVESCYGRGLFSFIYSLHCAITWPWPVAILICSLHHIYGLCVCNNWTALPLREIRTYEPCVWGSTNGLCLWCLRF